MESTKAIPGTPVVLDSALRESIRPAAATLPESGILEVVNYGRHRPDLTRLWVGESDQPTPAFICDAAISALRAGHTFYTYQRGIPQLRDALVDYHRRTDDVALDVERIIVTTSGMQGMMQTMQALVGAGDETVVVSPVWPNIFAAIHMQQALPVPVPLRPRNGRWHLDLDRLFDGCGPKTRALYINSPNNPTGWVMDRDEMIAVRDFARKHGLWIVADEVYNRFVYDRPRTTSFLELMGYDERLIVAHTFSKNWAMTGWRVGWLVIPRGLGQVFENLVQYNTSGTAGFLQYGCIAALEQGEAFLASTIERCRIGRDLACDALASLPNIELNRPQGAFYLFLRVEGENDSVALAKRLVDEANVGLAPGSAFGDGGEGYVRLCYAASHQTLKVGIERLCQALCGDTATVRAAG